MITMMTRSALQMPSMVPFAVGIGLVFLGMLGLCGTAAAYTRQVMAVRPKLGELNGRYRERVDFDLHESHSLQVRTNYGSMHNNGMHHGGGVRFYTKTHYTLVIQALGQG